MAKKIEVYSREWFEKEMYFYKDHTCDAWVATIRMPDGYYLSSQSAYGATPIKTVKARVASNLWQLMNTYLEEGGRQDGAL